MFGLVQHNRECPIDMPAQPATSPVRTPGRAPHAVHHSFPAWPYDNAAPLRPHKLPPAIIRNRAHLRTTLRKSLVPDSLRSHPDFAVDLKVIPIVDERINPVVHSLKRRINRQPFIPEIPRQPVLPDLMNPFDLPLGRRSVRAHESDAVEPQPLCELRVGSVVLAEERRLVDIYLQGKPITHESPVKQVQVRIHALMGIQGASNLKPAAVVKHVYQMQLRMLPAKEVVRRGVKLPQFPYARALPTPDVRCYPGLVEEALDAVVERPAPHLPPVHEEAELPSKLACRECVRILPVGVAVRAKDPAQERLRLLRPLRLVVAPGRSGQP